MNPRVFHEFLEVIKAEEQRRVSLLEGEDPDFAHDQWNFHHEPLLNELCLMLLVTLRHHVERELVDFAARGVDSGRTISRDEYKARLDQLRKVNKHGQSIGWDWKDIKQRLGIGSKCAGAKEKCVEALRLLANSYKHDPSVKPAEDLKKFLNLPPVAYAPLPESELVRQELGKLVGLSEDAPYRDIVEAYVDTVTDYLRDLESHTTLSNVQWTPVGLSLDELAH